MSKWQADEEFTPTLCGNPLHCDLCGAKAIYYEKKTKKETVFKLTVYADPETLERICEDCEKLELYQIALKRQLHPTLKVWTGPRG